uniref:LRRCT domain-containing protein n=1 Tax=Clastoptera arizonana TaxID=38151 RepID=A0A1B6CHW6_9HEMI
MGLLWGLLCLVALTSAEILEDLECPDDCDCHYFRVNWVTDCSESNLTSIPTLDEGLSLSVYFLNMNANNLTEINPFPPDIKIRTLQLAENGLTKIEKRTFAPLLYLLELDLSSNNITFIDSHAFTENPGLITLELQNNHFDPIEGPFLHARALINLDLRDCHISRLTPDFFINTTGINNLDLSGNPLRILEAGIFDPLMSLEHLKLNRCNLTHIAGTTFANIEHIRTLELSHNNLKGPVDWMMVLGHLGRLEQLDIRGSGIVNLPDNVFDNNTYLRQLILAENELVDLDVATTLGQNLKHLDFLDLSDCHLVGPLSENAFSNAAKLRILLLSGNKLFPATLSAALAHTTKLHKLSLKNCDLTRIPADTFHRLTSLQELDISRNPLNNAFTGLLTPLETLEHLDMGYSNLGRISKSTFSKMTSLKTLILSGNKLQSLESGLFQNLTHLVTLELNYCGLSRLNSTVFPDDFTYPDLEVLKLAGNPLTVPSSGSFLPRQLRRLHTLDLSFCNLTYIPRNALYSFGNITKLLLAGNNLAMFSASSLSFLNNLPLLEHLDLSLNKLTTMTPENLKENYYLKSLKLIGNPWQCDCNIVNMWYWASIHKGDLKTLIGSQTQPEDTTTSGTKRKKGLWCHFNEKSGGLKVLPNKRPGKRELVFNLNVTWARFVRESSCVWKSTDNSREVREVSEHLIGMGGPYSSMNYIQWSFSVVGGFIFIVLISWITVMLFSKKRKDISLMKTRVDIACNDDFDSTVLHTTHCHNIQRFPM